MPFWLWSYLLAAVGLLGIYLAGRKNRAGWAVGIGAQVLWIAYAIVTEQPGFLITALAYGAMYAKNYRAWSASSGETGGEADRLRLSLAQIRDREWMDNALDPQWPARYAAEAVGGTADADRPDADVDEVEIHG